MVRCKSLHNQLVFFLLALSWYIQELLNSSSPIYLSSVLIFYLEVFFFKENYEFFYPSHCYYICWQYKMGFDPTQIITVLNSSLLLCSYSFSSWRVVNLNMLIRFFKFQKNHFALWEFLVYSRIPVFLVFLWTFRFIYYYKAFYIYIVLFYMFRHSYSLSFCL